MASKSWANVILVLLCVPALAELPKGSLCVAAIPEKPNASSTPGLGCKSGKLSFKVDAMAEKSWPTSESLKIEDLDVMQRHRIVVSCDGKPQQSFRFTYSQFETKKLCLFINDFYKTAQLWDDKSSPWCKCR